MDYLTMSTNWDYNEQTHDYHAFYWSWLDHWDILSGVQMGVFVVLFMIATAITFFSRVKHKLSGQDKAVATFDMFMFTLSQVAAGIVLLVYIKGGELYLLTRSHTFASLSGTYWLQVYLLWVCTLPFQKISVWLVYLRSLSLALLIAGFVLSSIGIYSSNRQILYKVGIFLMLGANIGTSIMCGLLYTKFHQENRRIDYVYIFVASSLMNANLVYYINSIFNYKVYLFQSRYGLYIGLEMVVKYIVVVFLQSFFVHWQPTTARTYDSDSEYK